jgi:hypothetical protein
MKHPKKLAQLGGCDIHTTEVVAIAPEISDNVRIHFYSIKVHQKRVTNYDMLSKQIKKGCSSGNWS